MDDDDTDVFFGKFGEKYETETYKGVFAHNAENQNMMFFREEKTGTPYKLHAYMKLTKKKSRTFRLDYELFP